MTEQQLTNGLELKRHIKNIEGMLDFLYWARQLEEDEFKSNDKLNDMYIEKDKRFRRKLRDFIIGCRIFGGLTNKQMDEYLEKSANITYSSLWSTPYNIASLDYQFTKDFITFLEEHKAKYEEALEEL